MGAERGLFSYLGGVEAGRVTREEPNRAPVPHEAFGPKGRRRMFARSECRGTKRSRSRSTLQAQEETEPKPKGRQRRATPSLGRRAPREPEPVPGRSKLVVGLGA